MDAHAIVKPLLLKDLRIQLRARGLTPGGGIEELRERLAADMVATGNFAINMGEAAVEQQQQPAGSDYTFSPNNYARPGGAQNVGNRLTGKPSTKVSEPPGGKSQISFG